MSTTLMKYDAARVALEAATKIDEAKSIRDKAHALAAYARQAKDSDLINWAVEIKVRAERRAGELLKSMPKNAGAKGVGTSAVQKKDHTPTLAALGISKNDSSTWQKVAAIPAPKFEESLAAVQAQGEKLTTRTVLAVGKGPAPQKEPIDLADDVRNTLKALVKRWEHKRAVCLAAILTTHGNFIKGGL